MTKRLTALMIILTGLSVLVGCATATPGRFLRPEQPSAKDERVARQNGLAITGRTERSLSGKYFRFFEFSFLNETSEWIRVTSVEVSFGKSAAAEKVFIPVGEELVWWARAAIQQRKIDDHNRRLAMSIIAGLGAGLGAAAGNSIGGRQGALVGSTIAAGSAIGLTADAVQTHLRDLQASALIPEGHLLAGSFVVPPGLFSKHWMVIHMKDPKLLKRVPGVILRVNFANGASERFILRL